MPNTAIEARIVVPAPASRVTRERILDVAEGLFAERGLAGTSVRDIAGRARLTAASLYNHFSGKDALYEAVLDRGVKPLVELMQELASREQTPDVTEEILALVMAELGRRPALPRLIHQEVVTGGAVLTRLARDWIRPLLERGIAEMEREARSAEGSKWEPEEYPLVIAAWLHLIFGHFAMAPLLREVLDEDPLAPAVLERQTRFLRKLARLLMTARAPA